ncbi:MAG: ThiF family adenylyltransferase [Candidatus Methanomethylophilaceae archaeon]|nr:ThiF family adenylyltransferase [Candidatus Methanomethylophilaceae archaeon]
MTDLSAGYQDKDRYDRQRRIDWIDMDGIFQSKILVAGAGALGNEVVKNLVLSGFRHIDVVDMDEIVLSNLNRCLFFRDSDVKKIPKAVAVANKASELSPDAYVCPIVGKVQDIQTWDYDIVIGCLDNILARMHVNSHACYHGIPYIDGATDGMRGKVNAVLPGGPCLQCTMNKTHIREMEKRFSCTGDAVMFVPHLASDVTTTSVVAAMQVREAMKIASRRYDLCIRNVCYYDGTAGDMFILEVTTDPNCPNHEVQK